MKLLIQPIFNPWNLYHNLKTMTDSKETDTALSKAMKNPLAEATKKSDVANAISEDKTKKIAHNQISPQLDKFENSLIRKKKFKE